MPGEGLICLCFPLYSACSSPHRNSCSILLLLPISISLSFYPFLIRIPASEKRLWDGEEREMMPVCLVRERQTIRRLQVNVYVCVLCVLCQLNLLKIFNPFSLLEINLNQFSLLLLSSQMMKSSQIHRVKRCVSTINSRPTQHHKHPFLTRPSKKKDEKTQKISCKQQQQYEDMQTAKLFLVWSSVWRRRRLSKTRISCFFFSTTKTRLTVIHKHKPHTPLSALMFLLLPFRIQQFQEHRNHYQRTVSHQHHSSIGLTNFKLWSKILWDNMEERKKKNKNEKNQQLKQRRQTWEDRRRKEDDALSVKHRRWSTELRQMTGHASRLLLQNLLFSCRPGIG